MAAALSLWGLYRCLGEHGRYPGGGEAFGLRTIPEYLGDRYRSEAIRLMTAVFSMLLLFYLAG